jgi:DNA-binding NtrC family response regulator
MIEHKRILTVDDDARVLLIMRATLENLQHGTVVATAENGKEALAKIKEEPFDLVITDVRMPGLSGVELVEAIRELGTHTAVIWITAYGCVNLEADRERLDVSFCLEKPLRIGEIRQAALEALEIPSKDL